MLRARSTGTLTNTRIRPVCFPSRTFDSLPFKICRRRGLLAMDSHRVSFRLLIRVVAPRRAQTGESPLTNCCSMKLHRSPLTRPSTLHECWVPTHLRILRSKLLQSASSSIPQVKEDLHGDRRRTCRRSVITRAPYTITTETMPATRVTRASSTHPIGLALTRHRYPCRRRLP